MYCTFNTSHQATEIPQQAFDNLQRSPLRTIADDGSHITSLTVLVEFQRPITGHLVGAETLILFSF